MGIKYSPDFKVVIGVDGTLSDDLWLNCVEVINSFAFAKNSEIKSVHFPRTLKEINSNAFAKCNYLEDVDIRNEIILHDNAFKECVRLKSIHLNSKNIPVGSLSDCGQYLKDGVDIVLENTTTLGFYSISSSKIKSIMLPDTLKVIQERAFAYSEFPDTKLILPKNLETLGADIFIGTNLTDIYLPDSIKYINNICDTNLIVHMSEETFNRLGIKKTPNIKFDSINELIDNYTFRELNQINLKKENNIMSK